MTAPSTSCWDMVEDDGGARRPTLEDLGGAELEDAAGSDAPPRDGSELYADMVNQNHSAIAGACRTVPLLTFTLRFVAGAPEIASFQCVREDFEVANLTLADAGNGNTTVAWDDWRLPPMTCDPHLTINEFSASVNTGCVEIVSSPPTGKQQIRIRTQQGTTLTDIRCTVSIH